jgi:hypothetical protein
MKTISAWCTVALVLLSQAAPAYWEQMPGAARAIAMGANGAVWAIGMDRQAGGYGVYRWDGARFQQVPGIAGVRLAVDPRGNPWVVDSFSNVRRWTGRSWENLPGWGKDVAAGANGSLWSVGLEGGLYEFRGQRFEKVFPGRFERVAVTPNGVPWAVNEGHGLALRGPSDWVPMRPDVASVTIGASGAVWVLDGDGYAQELLADGSWLPRGGPFREIALGPDGLPWALTADYRILRGVPEF